MEQTVLSINDDKMTTRGELVEYPAELIGGRNLLINSNIFTTGWSIYGGAQVIRTPEQVVPEWGATDATKIETVGGSSVLKFYKQLSNPIVDDTRIISIWVKSDSDSDLNINFNGGTVLSGSSPLNLESGFSGRVIYNVRYYTGSFQLQFRATSAENSLNFTVWRMQVEKGTVATPWTPAPEDLGLSYPDWVTEFKPSISENGILAPEFDESGVLSFSINRTTAQEFIENPNL